MRQNEKGKGKKKERGGANKTEKAKTREKEKRQIKSPHTKITDNEIRAPGAQSIGEALKTITSLTSLELEG